MKTLVLVCLLLITPSAYAGPILGDWTTGFSTDYALNTASQFDPGTYSFIESHPLWVTPIGQPDGPTMFVNGRDDRTSTVWSKTFDAPADTTLTFSAWLGSVCCTLSSGLNFPGPTLNWLLNGSMFLNASTDGPGVMEPFSASFNTGAGGPYTLSLVNQSTVYNGNDFAMSNLDLQATPEPTSLLLLGTGCAFFVRRYRRRG